MATLKEKQDSLAAVEEKVSFGILVIYFDGLNSKCGRSLTSVREQREDYLKM